MCISSNDKEIIIRERVNVIPSMKEGTEFVNLNIKIIIHSLILLLLNAIECGILLGSALSHLHYPKSNRSYLVSADSPSHQASSLVFPILFWSATQLSSSIYLLRRNNSSWISSLNFYEAKDYHMFFVLKILCKIFDY